MSTFFVSMFRLFEFRLLANCEAPVGKFILLFIHLFIVTHYFCHRIDTSCSGSIKSYECGSTLWNLDYLPDVSLNRVLSQKTRSITLQLKGRIVVRNIDKQHIDLFSFIGLRPCDYY